MTWFIRCLTLGCVIGSMNDGRCEDWTPPKFPDPKAILREARADTLAKRYELALTKLIWIHEYGLKSAAWQTGNRYPFELTHWERLVGVYPPAMAKLVACRDQLGDRLPQLQGEDLRAMFVDFVAINNFLEDPPETVAVLIKLAQTRPGAARGLFQDAKRALLDQREYQLYAEFVEPEGELTRIKQTYELTTKLPERIRNRPIRPDVLLENHRQRYRIECATLVAVLVLNLRQQNADALAASARETLDDAEMRTIMHAALLGEVPAQAR
jgi:hypothetical protein